MVAIVRNVNSPTMVNLTLKLLHVGPLTVSRIFDTSDVSHVGVQPRRVRSFLVWRDNATCFAGCSGS